MIDLLHIACGKADLVAVGAVAVGRAPHQLLLGKLALHGLGYGHRGIGRPGDSHGLINISTAGKGIADGAAQAGGRSAEGLDLRGVVVGLVLEVHQPLLGLSVDLYRHHDAAGVDLVGFLLIFKLSLFF